MNGKIVDKYIPYSLLLKIEGYDGRVLPTGIPKWKRSAGSKDQVCTENTRFRRLRRRAEDVITKL